MQTAHGFEPTELLGQTRKLLLWKLVESLGLLLFTVVVPRAMGPTEYGELALLLSLVALLTMVSGLGALPTFGRFVPEYRAANRHFEIRVLFTQIFLARTAMAVAVGCVFLSTLPALLPTASPLVVIAGAVALVVSGCAATCFDLFYGFNALGRWLSREALLRLVLFLLLVLLGGLWSLDRAALALLLTHCAFLLVGLFWSGNLLTVDRRVMDGLRLRQHLSFGLAFFGANLLLLGVWRAGEIMIQLLSGESRDVAFYNVANALALTVATLLGQLGVMLGPSLAALHVSERVRQVDLLLGHALKYLTIAAFLFLYGVQAVGQPVIGAVLGESYLPVFGDLRLLAVGLIPIGLIRTSMSLAVLHKRPRELVPVTATALGVFLAVSFLLIPRLGDAGAAIAVSSGLWGAGLASLWRFTLGSAMRVARLGRVMLFGFSMGLLAWAGGATAALAIPLLLGTLFLVRALTLDEVRTIARSLVKRRPGVAEDRLHRP